MDARRVVRALKTPVTMLLMLAFVVLSAQWAWRAATAPVPPRPPEPCVVTELGPQLLPEHVYVQIYNGSPTNGAARRLASILRADGFNVIKTTNADNPDHPTSEVVGFAEDSPEVVLVRQAFDNIAFRADGRVDRTVDVVIGADGVRTIESPGFDVPLPDGTACVPQVEVVNSGE